MHAFKIWAEAPHFLMQKQSDNREVPAIYVAFMRVQYATCCVSFKQMEEHCH